MGIDKVSPNAKHCNITSAIKKLRSLLPIAITCKHVKGHQNDEIDFEDLDRIAQLNVMMDIDAKSLLEEIKASMQYIPFQEEHAQHPFLLQALRVHNEIICDKYTENTYKIITDKKVLDHWINKGRFKKEDAGEIDWPHFQQDVLFLNGPQTGLLVVKI